MMLQKLTGLSHTVANGDVIAIRKFSQSYVVIVILTLLFAALAVPVQSSEAASPTGLESFFYTQDEAILFSYDNSTYFVVKDSGGSISWNGTLNEGESKQLTLGAGIYSVTASKPYTVIVGAPQTQNVVGYFALDIFGKGTSTDLYTYIPPYDPLYPESKIIIFAYTNGTVVTVTDVHSKTILWRGTLNKSAHFSQDLNNATWQNKTVHIESTFPVSALCYLDQGFIVPSSTGLFTGTLFYTFAGNITNGNNDLNVIGYHDNTWITISNSTSKSLVWNGTLNAGEVHSEVFAKPTYLTVESNQSIAVTVDPYQTWPIMYQAALYAGDEDGSFIGKNFFATARGGGYLRIIAYQNDTHVTVTDQKTRILVWDGTLDEMELHTRSTSHTVYNITSDKAVSVQEGYGEWSTMFAPLYYTADTEPPTIGISSRTPQNPTPSQEVRVSVNVSDDLTGVQKVILSYNISNAVWTNLTMIPSGGNMYAANISAMPSQTLVNYRIIAYDYIDNEAVGANACYVVASHPTGSIVINNGEIYAASPSATLTLTYSGTSTAVSQVRYSNDGTWDTEQWESPSPSKGWSLSQGDGAKTVYYQVSNVLGMFSPTYSDSIILDSAAPYGSIIINGGAAATTSTSVTLTLTYTDATSGVYQVRYSNDGVWDAETWESPSATKAWTLNTGDGTKTVYWQIRDNAGLLSSTYLDSISLQSSSPSPNPEPGPTPTPSPSPEPTPSPTPSPTPEPEPTPSPEPQPEPTPPQEPLTTQDQPLFFYLIVVAIAFAVTGVAVFVIKRRK